MSYDPFGDDPDADIFRDDEPEDNTSIAEPENDPDLDVGTGHKHTIDGTECPTCQVIHQTPFDGEIDPHVENSILSFFDAMPDELVCDILDGSNSRRNRPQAEMLTSFLDFTERMDRTNTLGPVLRAIVEHLDEQTDGRISAKWHIYEAERKLVVSHKILKSINTALDDARAGEASRHYTSILELLIDFAEERLKILKENYHEQCAKLNEEPHESLLEYGKYPDDKDRNTQKIVIDELYKELTAH